MECPIIDELETKADGSIAQRMAIMVTADTIIRQGQDYLLFPARQGNSVVMTYVTEKGQKVAKSSMWLASLDECAHYRTPAAFAAYLTATGHLAALVHGELFAGRAAMGLNVFMLFVGFGLGSVIFR